MKSLKSNYIYIAEQDQLILKAFKEESKGYKWLNRYAKNGNLWKIKLI